MVTIYLGVLLDAHIFPGLQLHLVPGGAWKGITKCPRYLSPDTAGMLRWGDYNPLQVVLGMEGSDPVVWNLTLSPEELVGLRGPPEE